MMPRICLMIGALLGASGVGLGAYHAHGLEKFLERQSLPPAVQARRLDNCETAVKYQMFHALAFLALAAVASQVGGRVPQVAAGCWLLGVAAFSGGLYLIVFTGQVGHWAIVPSGGVLLIVGWSALLFTPRPR